MNKHIIRLRQPWQRLDRPEAILFTRRFGKPSGLDQQQRVYLVIAGPVELRHVTLNEQPLESSQWPWRSDITDLLHPRNQLTIEATRDELPDVRLEIA